MIVYEELKHMEKIRESIDNKKLKKCYLPLLWSPPGIQLHNKAESCVQWSQRTRSGESLKAHFHIGANLLPTLADILLRWRWYRYVFVIDIEKMYRQILVHPQDRDWQWILWRRDETDDVNEYRLNAVIWLACAPFLTIQTFRQQPKRSHIPELPSCCATTAMSTTSLPVLTRYRARSQFGQSWAGCARRAGFHFTSGPRITRKFLLGSPQSIDSRKHHTHGKRKGALCWAYDGTQPRTISPSRFTHALPLNSLRNVFSLRPRVFSTHLDGSLQWQRSLRQRFSSAWLRKTGTPASIRRCEWKCHCLNAFVCPAGLATAPKTWGSSAMASPTHQSRDTLPCIFAYPMTPKSHCTC